jgi:hypothetical protein
MAINGITIEPAEITMAISLVFLGWVILVGMAQVFKAFDVVEDILLVFLVLLVGLRFALVGMIERDLLKTFLFVPLASCALRLLRHKLGR